jgi:hypothetical protein
VESSCERGNEPGGSIKCWEVPLSGDVTGALPSGAELHAASWLEDRDSSYEMSLNLYQTVQRHLGRHYSSQLQPLLLQTSYFTPKFNINLKLSVSIELRPLRFRWTALRTGLPVLACPSRVFACFKCVILGLNEMRACFCERSGKATLALCCVVSYTRERSHCVANAAWTQLHSRYPTALLRTWLGSSVHCAPPVRCKDVSRCSKDLALPTVSCVSRSKRSKVCIAVAEPSAVAATSRKEVNIKILSFSIAFYTLLSFL